MSKAGIAHASDPLAALARVEPFAEAGADVLETLRGDVRLVSLAEGEALAEEPAGAHSISVVVDGTLTVQVEDADTSSVETDNLGAGSILGSVDPGWNGDSPAVVAAADSTVLTVSAPGLSRLEAAAPYIARRVRTAASARESRASVLEPYVPRLLRGWIDERPEATHLEFEGSVAFIDLSGFTALSERLARQGRVGAEELSDTIGTCFAQLLAIAYANDAGLIKFGGDALLLLFTGTDHEAKACRAAIGMRRKLRDVGRIETTMGRIRLRMSVGVHSGPLHCFLVGGSHRELILTGPGATETVLMETSASPGEILVSDATAARLPASMLGGVSGPGRLLRRAPQAPGRRLEHLHEDVQDKAHIHPDEDKLLACVPVAVRDHLLAGSHEPEHRRVTVAFLQFGGTDALIRRRGAEATAEHLDALVRDVQAAVDRHGVSFLGTDIDRDGGKLILAAGAPVGLGNDEERMLLALRELMDAERDLSVRAGVHRGHVFAGDIGPSYRRTYTVMGDAVNLAARVMGRAGTGQILATEEVVSQSRTTFDVTPLDPFTVKGKSRPVRALSVGQVARARGRESETRHPLVGRAQELAELTDALASAREGTGRVVEVVGEPGLGKSRLVEEFRQRADGATQVSLARELYESSTPYFPFWRPLRGLLGISDDTRDEQAAARLCDVVRSVDAGLAPWAPLLGALLNLEMPPTPETAQLEEKFRRPQLHRVAFRLLARLLREPAAFIVEDAHWMDEASADLLRHLADQVTEAPWLICVTRRDVDSGFVAPGAPHVTTLRLSPLQGDDATALAEAVTEAVPLPPHEMVLLVERSGGNPLYLKELIAAARAAGSLEGLPDSVEALITARIDRLPSADRTALRFLAVLGQSFPRHLAEAVLPHDTASGRDGALRRLDEFLEFANGSVRFSHALIRDAAYEALSYRLRRRLHSEVGDTIERAAGEDPDSQAEVLSFHFFHAQRHAEAWRYSLVAAESAKTLFANVAASSFYERALVAGKRLKDLVGVEAARIHEELGDVRDLMGAFAEAASSYRAARALVTDDPATQARLLLKIGRTQGWLGRYAQALRSIRRALNTLEGVESPAAAQQRAQLLVWYGHFCQEAGRHKAALDWCRRGIAEATAAGEREALAHAYRVLDWAYTELGQIQNAVNSAKALAIYEEIGDLPGQAAVLNNMGAIAYLQGRWGDALSLYQRALDIWTRTGDEVGVAFARANIGEILSDQGRLEEAEGLFRKALRAWQAAGHRSRAASAQRDLARVESRLHRHDEALRRFGDVRAEFEDVGARVDVVETDARIAESYMLEGNGAEALRRADSALQRARTLGGVAAQNPMLHRIRAYALMQLGDHAAARHALEESLAAARQREADYEIALALRGFADLAAVTDAPGQEQHVAESDAILERLGVVQVPAAPLMASRPGAS